MLGGDKCYKENKTRYCDNFYKENKARYWERDLSRSPAITNITRTVCATSM